MLFIIIIIMIVIMIIIIIIIIIKWYLMHAVLSPLELKAFG